MGGDICGQTSIPFHKYMPSISGLGWYSFLLPTCPRYDKINVKSVGEFKEEQTRELSPEY